MTLSRIYESETLGEGVQQEPAPNLSSAIPLHDSTTPRLTEPAGGGSVLLFARERYYWSPARAFRVLKGLSTNLPLQIKLLRIMRVPAYAEFAFCWLTRYFFLPTDPRFRFKFLVRDYPVRGFSTGQRAACFLHHYKRLHESLSIDLLYRTLHQRVTVFEARREEIHVEISLSLSRPFGNEGELSLNLHVDGTIVFILSFTMIPGWVVESEAEEVLLISRLQGANGCYSQIRDATKALHNVGPAALLLAALDGFAKAFDIGLMAGVSAVRQASFTEALSVFYATAYDDFFIELGTSKNGSGFFLSSIPPEERPMSSIKQGHKIRTKEKRQFKRQLAEDICLLLRQEMRIRESEPSREEEGIRIVNPFGVS
jgi:uncharacterized protein VirK/YbjX